MESSIAAFAREQLIIGLYKCNEKQVNLFKQMYSFEDREADIETAVANMPDNKLDWALEQVNRTVSRNEIE